MPAPRVTVLYHFMHPDDVVSARQLSDLAEGLAARGFEVEARPSNRAWDDRATAFPHEERWHEVAYHRVWRPAFKQASGAGRLLNAAWMIAAWSALGLSRNPPDVIVVGTDPVLAVLVARAVKRLRPSVKIAHWCFDVYPEAPIAEGMIAADGVPARILDRLLRPAYAACDLVADIGPCMRAMLDAYGHGARRATLTPWALVEPAEVEQPDPETRRELFGEASLGLLYAGTFGRAHAHEDILALARRLRGDDVGFCFGVRGNRAGALAQAVGPDDRNVRFAGFAPEAALARRLGAADVHLASLRHDWTGVVVPSKFFGSLAIGRPVIFAGSRESSIARWIEEHGVGWVLDAGSIDRVAADLQRLAGARAELEALWRRCHRVYREHFSKEAVIGRWDDELRRLLK
ncbi:Glycosyltransferase [Minicystis rosea]|nr:Glycosyltransferase [Minicystis rosea]